MIPLKVLNVVGGSRDLIKIAPIMQVMRESREVEPVLVHTGRPLPDVFSGVVLRDMRVPQPDVFLDVAPGSHAQQTAAIMERFEGTVADIDPDLVLVIGDVNSTVAASITAVKKGVPVAHVEAGLRSFDRQDSKEINRVMTDSISDFLFVSEDSAIDNLMCEGITASRIHFVGNVLIDSLFANCDRILESKILESLGLEVGEYAVLALCRTMDTSEPQYMQVIVDSLEMIQRQIPVILPVHFETVGRLHRLGLWDAINNLANVNVIESIAYLDFIALLKGSRLTLTDTNGVQEETTSLQVPCLTFGDRTERPATVSKGTNRLVGRDPHAVVAEALRVLRGGGNGGGVPPMWDGQAAHRLVARLLDDREEVLERYRHVRITNQCTTPSTHPE